MSDLQKTQSIGRAHRKIKSASVSIHTEFDEYSNFDLNVYFNQVVVLGEFFASDPRFTYDDLKMIDPNLEFKRKHWARIFNDIESARSRYAKR